jgi:hypothetical protein
MPIRISPARLDHPKKESTLSKLQTPKTKNQTPSVLSFPAFKTILDGIPDRHLPFESRTMTRKPKPRPTYEDVVLNVLAYEFDFSDKLESEKKIKRRLRDKKVGAYDQARIDLLRQFKNEVQTEVHRGSKSNYYTYPHGEPDGKGQLYVDMEDFDRVRMSRDYAAMFPDVPRPLVRSFVEFSVFIYYVK